MTRLELSLCTAAVAVICLPLVLVLVREKREPVAEITVTNNIVRADGTVYTNVMSVRKPQDSFMSPADPAKAEYDSIISELIVDCGMTPSQAVECYVRVAEFARARRATNRGVFPGARVGMPTNQIPEEP